MAALPGNSSVVIIRDRSLIKMVRRLFAGMWGAEDMKINFIKDFIEANYGQFQAWLEDEYEVEGSEAEIILDELETAYAMKEAYVWNWSAVKPEGKKAL
jgi:hypothetical protein